MLIFVGVVNTKVRDDLQYPPLITIKHNKEAFQKTVKVVKNKVSKTVQKDGAINIDKSEFTCEASENVMKGNLK